MDTNEQPSIQSKTYRWFFLCEAVLAAVVSLVLLLIAIEGAFDINTMPGFDAKWVWRPIADSIVGAVSYSVAFILSCAWALRRFILFFHPERESRLRF